MYVHGRKTTDARTHMPKVERKLEFLYKYTNEISTQHHRCLVKSWIYRLWAVFIWAATDAKLQMAFHHQRMQQFSLKCTVSETFTHTAISTSSHKDSGHRHMFVCVRVCVWAPTHDCCVGWRPIQILCENLFFVFIFSCTIDSCSKSTFIYSWRIVGDARVWGNAIYFHFQMKRVEMSAFIADVFLKTNAIESTVPRSCTVREFNLCPLSNKSIPTFRQPGSHRTRPGAWVQT